MLGVPSRKSLAALIIESLDKHEGSFNVKAAVSFSLYSYPYKMKGDIVYSFLSQFSRIPFQAHSPIRSRIVRS